MQYLLVFISWFLNERFIGGKRISDVRVVRWDALGRSQLYLYSFIAALRVPPLCSLHLSTELVSRRVGTVETATFQYSGAVVSQGNMIPPPHMRGRFSRFDGRVYGAWFSAVILALMVIPSQ